MFLSIAESGESRGVGFARVSSVEAAEKAIEELHNTVPALGSSRIAVKVGHYSQREPQNRTKEPHEILK